MKCPKCQYKNSYKASYCYQCGYQYTKEEKEKEANSKLVKFLKSARNIYDSWNLNNITDNIYFRLLSLALILIISLSGIITNGLHLRIEKSDNYTYQYNKKDNEYYLYTNSDTTKLNLYTIGEVSQINVSYFDEEGNIINENNYSNYNDITLNTNTFTNNYYIITCKKDKLKLYVYKN